MDVTAQDIAELRSLLVEVEAGGSDHPRLNEPSPCVGFDFCTAQRLGRWMEREREVLRLAATRSVAHSTTKIGNEPCLALGLSYAPCALFC